MNFLEKYNINFYNYRTYFDFLILTTLSNNPSFKIINNETLKCLNVLKYDKVNNLKSLGNSKSCLGLLKLWVLKILVLRQFSIFKCSSQKWIGGINCFNWICACLIENGDW